MRERTNEQWLAELGGPDSNEALADLRVLLLRGLGAALGKGSGNVEPAIEDFAQEALIKILGNLDSFRSECRFTVWAQKIAVRTAFAEMRHRRWRDVSLEGVIADQEDKARSDPEQAAEEKMIMAEFRRFVDEELTSRQRKALLAAMGGMALEEIAHRMGTNRNALYKLLHDARKRLRRRMMTEKWSPQDVLGVFER